MFSVSFYYLHLFKDYYVKKCILNNGIFLLIIFTVNSIKYVVSKEFGDLNKTTNSTGLLNNLIRGDIDLAAFSLVRTPERAKAFHFFYDLNSAR